MNFNRKTYVKEQQTPNPAAQLPSTAPPLLLHSEEVKHVPYMVVSDFVVHWLGEKENNIWHYNIRYNHVWYMFSGIDSVMSNVEYQTLVLFCFQLRLLKTTKTNISYSKFVMSKSMICQSHKSVFFFWCISNLAYES